MLKRGSTNIYGIRLTLSSIPVLIKSKVSFSVVIPIPAKAKSKDEIKEGKASELAFKDDLLFIRNSLTGTVQCKPNAKSVNLNEDLHSNN